MARRMTDPKVLAALRGAYATGDLTATQYHKAIAMLAAATPTIPVVPAARPSSFLRVLRQAVQL